MAEPSDWSWLADTYWYVPEENLPALRLDTSDNALAWLVDQTVWHVTGYREGFFWGVSATLLREAGEELPRRGRGSKPMSDTMVGSITPEGRIHQTFVSSRRGTSTIGIGRAIPHEHGWSLEMQMSSGSWDRTVHWAYMHQVRPGEPSWDLLPGVGLSVPQMLENAEPPEAPAAVVVREDGIVEMRPENVDLMSLRGILKSSVKGVTLRDMKEAIRRGATGE